MVQTTKEQRTQIKEVAVGAYEDQTNTTLAHQKYNRYLTSDGLRVVIKTSNDIALLANVRAGEEDTNDDARIDLDDTDVVVFVPMNSKPENLNQSIYIIPTEVVIDRMKKGHKQWQNGKPKGDSRRVLYFRDAPNASNEAQGVYSFQDKFRQYRIDDDIVAEAAAAVAEHPDTIITGEDLGNAIILDDTVAYRVPEVAAVFLDKLRQHQNSGTFTTYFQIWETLYADLRFNFPVLMRVMDLAGRKHYAETGDIGLLSLVRRDDGILPEGFLDWADKVREH